MSAIQKQETAITPRTPMDLLALAIEKEGSIDVIERLAALQREEREYAAKVAFEAALGRAQASMGRIRADMDNPQTRSRYASYASMDRVLRPIYSREGLALSFDTGESHASDSILVLCHVSHELGHVRTYRIPMPADGKGAKGGDVMTKTHATGAAATYGMRYLLKMIFNVAVGEDDTDGNLQRGERMEEPVLLEWLDGIRQSPNMAALKDVFRKAYTQAKEMGDGTAQREITAEYEKAKKGLA